MEQTVKSPHMNAAVFISMELIIKEDLPKGKPLSSRSMLYVVAIIAPLLDTMPMTSTTPLSSSSSWEKRITTGF